VVTKDPLNMDTDPHSTPNLFSNKLKSLGTSEVIYASAALNKGARM